MLLSLQHSSTFPSNIYYTYNKNDFVLIKLKVMYIIDQTITIEVLKYMKPMHVEKLLKNYTLGVQLKFEKELTLWQQKVQTDPITILPEKDQQSKILPAVESIVKVFNVVKDSPNGKLVLDYFKIYKKLNDSIRCKLVDMIIHYIISSKMPMTIKLADSIADQIVCMFSSEVKVPINLIFKLPIICYYW